MHEREWNAPLRVPLSGQRTLTVVTVSLADATGVTVTVAQTVLEPAELVAETAQACAVPIVNDVTMIGLAIPVAVRAAPPSVPDTRQPTTAAPR